MPRHHLLTAPATWWCSMPDKPEEFREQIGIYTNEWSEIVVGSPAWEARKKRVSRVDHWRDYFPSKEWLEKQFPQNKRMLAEYSREWFAERMVRYLGLLDNSVIANDAVNAAIYACELGRLMSESNMKDWEDHALRGRDTLASSARGGEARAAKFKSRHDAIRSDYQERLARLGDESAAKNSTAREFAITRRTLNRILAK